LDGAFDYIEAVSTYEIFAYLGNIWKSFCMVCRNSNTFYKIESEWVEFKWPWFNLGIGLREGVWALLTDSAVNQPETTPIEFEAML
jgi:hypothetical protein